MNIFIEIHKDLPREGPGSNQCTRKALSLLKDLSPKPYILDIGCGPGMQTIEIAKRIDGNIVALDNHEPFLDKLMYQAKKGGIDDRITIIKESMLTMSFDERVFDVIWSEGAIFIIGFEKGLKEWRKFLKKRGYVVVSEVSWLKNNPPKQLKQFWEEMFPQMKTVEGNIDIIKDVGYECICHFIVPESGWWNDYYLPMENRIATLREKYKDNIDASKALDAAQLEIEMYRNYSDYYGNVFYVMRN